MNPYQPPQCNEPTTVTDDAPVMQVRYGLQYSLRFLFSGILLVGVAVVMVITLKKPIEIAVLPAVAGVANVAVAVLCLGRVYFEVFEDRIELLSPVFPKWRRARPFASMSAPTLDLYLREARRDDMNRFVAWRESSASLRFNYSREGSSA